MLKVSLRALDELAIRLKCDDRDPKLDVAAKSESSNTESLSKTPERLSETKKRMYQELVHQHRSKK